VALFSGTRLTDRNVEVSIHRQVRRIVTRFVQHEIDEADAVRQLTDLFVKAVKAMTRAHDAREGVTK
jgi:hypothetical protein